METPKHISDIILHLLEIRKIIDSYMNSVAFLLQSREVSLANTSLQRAMGWMGKALQYTGSTNPYPQNSDPESTQIDPRADHDENNNLLEQWKEIEFSQTTRIKHFRSCLEKTIVSTKSILDIPIVWLVLQLPAPADGNLIHHCVSEAWSSLIDAKMWLGWELGRIKKLKDGIAINIPKVDLPL